MIRPGLLILTCAAIVIPLRAECLIPYDEAKIVCYFSSWATYRLADGKFDVEDIDPTLCTHAVYSFAGVNNETFEIMSLDTWNDLPDEGGLNAYARFVNLKAFNPDLKVLLAVGGYTHPSITFSNMASKETSRKTFINSTIAFLNEFGFDGLDIDWEYPSNNGGRPKDKDNFVLLLQEIKEEFDKNSLILTAAVSMGVEVIETAYDIPSIAKSLDSIHLMAYDYHGSWDNTTNSHCPLFGRPGDFCNDAFYNVNASVNIWIEGGAPPEKLILGVPMYGQTFFVSDCQGKIGEPSLGPGAPGPYTGQNGMLGYNEICLDVDTTDAELSRDEYTISPWTCLGDTWVSFDDTISSAMKSSWAKNLGLGGSMIWSIDTDDFKGKCGQRKFPLLNALNKVWRNFTAEQVTTPSPVPSKSTAKVTSTFTSTQSVIPSTKSTPIPCPPGTTTTTTTSTQSTTPSSTPVPEPSYNFIVYITLCLAHFVYLIPRT